MLYKKYTSIALMMIFLSISQYAQGILEVDGKLQVNNMPSISDADQFMISADGTLILKPANTSLISTEMPRSIQYYSQYTDYGANYEIGMYYKHERRVYLGGLVRKVSGGNIAQGDTIGYLEKEYWPEKRILTSGFQNSNHLRINIEPDGYVKVFSTPPNTLDYISLEGIQYDRPDRIGDHVEGGIIFYLANPPEDLNGDGYPDRGLVSALEDMTPGAPFYPFGCISTSVVGTSADVGAGYENTLLIVDACDSLGIAARECLDYIENGYDDWFLPSEHELDLMFDNLADSDGNGENDGFHDPTNLGDFQRDHYHSSTEPTGLPDRSVRVRFVTGSSSAFLKDVYHRVRPIRVF